MNNDRYGPPPPPYELFLQHDQKISEELQAIEASKVYPFPDDEASKEQTDCKESKVVEQKIATELIISPLRIQKRSAKSDSSTPRSHRPLPPCPFPAADAHRPSLPGPGQGSKIKELLESKEELSRQDRVAESQTIPPPPFSATARPSEGSSYLLSLPHPSASYPSNTTPRPPYNPPNQRYGNSPPPSPFYPEKPAEASSSGRLQSIPRNSSQPRNLGMRLTFDPSVAYSGSQADAWNPEPPRGAYTTSLYSSAVSSHLHPGSSTPGSRQSYVSASFASSAETLRLDKADRRSVQSRSSVIEPAASTVSFSYPPRPRMISDYEQRWATSESDIHKDVYRGRP